MRRATDRAAYTQVKAVCKTAPSRLSAANRAAKELDGSEPLRTVTSSSRATEAPSCGPPQTCKRLVEPALTRPVTRRIGNFGTYSA
jgi:hypothetical protein